MKAILIGASGLIGQHLLQELLADSSVESVKLIGRRSLGLSHPKLSEAIIDFENESAYRDAISDADTIFCCVGTTQKKVKGDQSAYRKVDYDIPVRAARYAAAKGFQRYLLVSSVGADPKSSNFYLKLKGEVEAAIAAQSIPSIYFMRPSILLGARQESRIGETVGKGVMQAFSFLLLGGMRRYKPIQGKDVAKAMLRAAKGSQEGRWVWEYGEMLG
ncbi:MAG: NAD(P)H-binding protein [Bacteroidota bacterium]|nr:NAD(P)H-binding protein [Bacteroidota bacterium]